MRRKHFISSDCNSKPVSICYRKEIDYGKRFCEKERQKWYYRFYVEDASGNPVQKEFAGTESKSETEKLLRQAMEDYEAKKFIAKADNITLSGLLDVWVEEELKPGTLSNGTVGTYLQAINRIKQHPIGSRKLKTVASGHLQQFMDLLSFGGTEGSFVSKGYSADYVRAFSAVLNQSFRFVVFPKQYITFNPMQYVVMRRKSKSPKLFAEEEDADNGSVKPLSHEMYLKLIQQLGKRSGDAILPVRIAYFTGLRLGEVCGLNWQDINLEEQCLTVRKSIRFNGATHKHEIGPTKRKKVQVVDFGDALTDILRKAKKEQHKTVSSMAYSISGTITGKLQRKTEFITSIIIWTELRMFRMITGKSPLSV